MYGCVHGVNFRDEMFYTTKESTDLTAEGFPSSIWHKCLCFFSAPENFQTKRVKEPDIHPYASELPDNLFAGWLQIQKNRENGLS